MATKYRWFKTISNVYLGKTLIIRGMTRTDVEQRAAIQVARWSQQESLQRARHHTQLSKQAQQDHLLALEEQASQDTIEAQNHITAVQELLPRGLKMRSKFKWESLKQLAPYPAFHFQEPNPKLEDIRQSIGVPSIRPLVENLFGGQKAKREELESRAHQAYQAAVALYEQRKQDAYQSYETQRVHYEKGRVEYNTSIDQKRLEVERGDPNAVVWYMTRILTDFHLPEDYGTDFDCNFEQSSGIAVLNMQLPTLEELPHISSYKFVKSRKAIDTIAIKQKDLETLYDAIIHQIALLTIHFIFQEAKITVLQSVVFNGWVTGIDKKTGNEFTSCIISVQAPRDIFSGLKLERVDPKECIRNLKGLVAGPLAQLAPVKPILDLNREDSRFVGSREVLDTLSSEENLAQMDWEDFEHLVRELFEKVFGGDGSEVRITQASRDRGVDAIAFDPDPIRGGKFVIQAKRYNNVVPVSAVRDLYGTMMNEGAVKGILVTTSHYGNDAREFAKDKPLTLIDGSNLIHMFQDYGYHVTIEIQK